MKVKPNRMRVKLGYLSQNKPIKPLIQIQQQKDDIQFNTKHIPKPIDFNQVLSGQNTLKEI